MSDPFQSPAKDQLYREAQYGMAILTCLLALFVYLAINRISGRPRHVPDHVLNAPVAKTIQPDGSPLGYTDRNHLANARRLPNQQRHNVASAESNFKNQREPSLLVPSQVRAASAIEPIESSEKNRIHRAINVPTSDGEFRVDRSPQRKDQFVGRSGTTNDSKRTDMTNVKPRSQNRIAQAADDLQKALEALGDKRDKLESAYETAEEKINVRPIDGSSANQFGGKATGRDSDPHQTKDLVRSKLKNDSLPSPIATSATADKPSYDFAATASEVNDSNLKRQSNQFTNGSHNGDDSTGGSFAPPSPMSFEPEEQLSPKPDNHFSTQPSTKSTTTISQQGSGSTDANPIGSDRNGFEPQSVSLPNQSTTAQVTHSNLPLTPVPPSIQKAIEEMDNGFAIGPAVGLEPTNSRYPEPEIKPSRPRKDQTTSILDKEGELSKQFDEPLTSRKTERSDSLEITSQANDNFYALAQKHYDDGRYFRALFEHNQGAVRSFNLIPNGTKLSIPSKETLQRAYPKLCPAEELESVLRNGRTEPGQSASERIYETQGGETLYDIAREQLGQASRYLELLKINEEWLESDIDHLTRLPSGIRLVLPPKSIE